MKYKLEIKEIKKYYYEDDNEIPLYSCDILLDGENLINIISNYEKSNTFFIKNKECVGNYEGIDLYHLKKMLIKLNQRVSVYQCKEHLNGDWVLSFDIKIKGLNVYWKNFRLKSERPLRIYGFSNNKYAKYSSSHPFDNEIEYKDFPEIKFNLFQYFFTIFAS